MRRNTISLSRHQMIKKYHNSSLFTYLTLVKWKACQNKYLRFSFKNRTWFSPVCRLLVGVSGGEMTPDWVQAEVGFRAPVGKGWPLFSSCLCSCCRKRGGTSLGTYRGLGCCNGGNCCCRELQGLRLPLLVVAGQGTGRFRVRMGFEGMLGLGLTESGTAREGEI